MTIQRHQVREIRRLQERFAETMESMRAIVDAPTADERYGVVVVRMEEDLVRIARRARDELVALDRPNGRGEPDNLAQDGPGAAESVTAHPDAARTAIVAATGVSGRRGRTIRL